MKPSLLLLCLLCGCEMRVKFKDAPAPSTNNTLTYTVQTPVWETTNAVAVIIDHEKKVPPCTLILYIEGGKTNAFHAWAVPVVVLTNK